MHKTKLNNDMNIFLCKTSCFTNTCLISRGNYVCLISNISHVTQHHPWYNDPTIQVSLTIFNSFDQKSNLRKNIFN